VSNVNVCGAGCWQLLHGYYSHAPNEGEVLPARVPKIERRVADEDEDEDEDEAEADDEAEPEDEGEGEGEDDDE
jgi:hypothetical protein